MTTAAEHPLVTTLGRLAEDAAAQRFGSPAILVIGDVLQARAAVTAGAQAAA